LGQSVAVNHLAIPNDARRLRDAITQRLVDGFSETSALRFGLDKRRTAIADGRHLEDYGWISCREEDSPVRIYGRLPHG